MLRRGAVRVLGCAFLIAALPLAVVRVGRLEAQNRSARPSLAAAIAELRIGAQIRVLTGTDTGRIGTFLGLDERGVPLSVNDEKRAVFRPEDVAELSCRRRAWRKGLWIGAGVGTIIGGVFGAGNVEGSAAEAAGLAAFGAVVVGLPLGGLGATLGAMFHEWHRAFP